MRLEKRFRSHDREAILDLMGTAATDVAPEDHGLRDRDEGASVRVSPVIGAPDSGSQHCEPDFRSDFQRCAVDFTCLQGWWTPGTRSDSPDGWAQIRSAGHPEQPSIPRAGLSSLPKGW